jgi:hypothetical protein
MEAMAKVKLTIQFDLPDHWNTDCQVDQIFKQAVDSATGFIRNKLPPYIKVVDIPQVTAILLNK